MRLDIFVDETGDFGFSKDSSLVYGVSFVFHERRNSIRANINALKERLNRIGYLGMIHTANLITNRGEYKNISLEKRKSIFNAIYYFSLEIDVKYKSIFIDKRYLNNRFQLKMKIESEINKFINKNKEYFNKFKEINLYYDNGQRRLGNVLDNVFSRLDGFNHIIEFDHVEEKLFQVADMLTILNKYDYKYKNKIHLTESEKYFLANFNLRKLLININKKDL